MEVELDKNDELIGNKKKVASSSTFNNPKIVILDEPNNGLDPLIQQKLFNILLKERLREKQSSYLLITYLKLKNSVIGLQ